jgi:hypothetical protein
MGEREADQHRHREAHTEVREEPTAHERFAFVRAFALSFLIPALAACPKKPPPPTPAASTVDAGEVAVAVDAGAVDLDAAVAEPFDAWVPDHPKLTLEVDWENRYGDAPRFNYKPLGLPALSPDGQRVVVPGTENDRSQDPSFRLITLLADDREESSVTLQNVREYRDAMYPADVDYPTPAITDPVFKKLAKDVNKRLADATATLAAYHPLPPCRLVREGEAGVRITAECVGLQVVYEQHHLRVIGHGGHVRLDRSVAAWKLPTVALPPGYDQKEELHAMYGDAAHNMLVVEMMSVAMARYYGGTAARWHIVKLGP